jgi:hypothetical protein
MLLQEHAHRELHIMKNKYRSPFKINVKGRYTKHNWPEHNLLLSTYINVHRLFKIATRLISAHGRTSSEYNLIMLCLKINVKEFMKKYWESRYHGASVDIYLKHVVFRDDFQRISRSDVIYSSTKWIMFHTYK